MSFLYLNPGIFCVARCSTLSQTLLHRILVIDHYPVILEIGLFTALNSFAGEVRNQTYGSSISKMKRLSSNSCGEWSLWH